MAKHSFAPKLTKEEAQKLEMFGHEWVDAPPPLHTPSGDVILRLAARGLLETQPAVFVWVKQGWGIERVRVSNALLRLSKRGELMLQRHRAQANNERRRVDARAA